MISEQVIGIVISSGEHGWSYDPLDIDVVFQNKVKWTFRTFSFGNCETKDGKLKIMLCFIHFLLDSFFLRTFIVDRFCSGTTFQTCLARSNE